MTGKHSSENTRGCPGLLQESFIVREERRPASGGRGNGLPAAQRTLSVSAGGTKGLGSIKSIERRPDQFHTPEMKSRRHWVAVRSL